MSELKHMVSDHKSILAKMDEMVKACTTQRETLTPEEKRILTKLFRGIGTRMNAAGRALNAR